MYPRVEIMDTTLRDGEQTSGVSFNAREKLSIARLLLEELCVSRIEIASARVSQGEQEAVRRIAEWAAAKGYTDRIEALGFIDGGVSLDWLGQAGCRVVNLLAKGSLKHCREQLRRTSQEHLCDIRATIGGAVARGMKVNVYLEDWSNGMQDSPGYVYTILDGLADAPVQRFMCPDTLGILDPYATERFCRDMVTRYPQLRFDFHAHNDYDLAVANTAAAVKAGFHGVHVTINGLGERAGNAPLSSTVAVLHDRLHCLTGIDETKINHVSRMVETYTGIRIPGNRPIVGENVFTQCAGIHADGDNKNNLYFNELLPERFGRVREYALGKTSGKANILKNLEALGIELDEASMRKVTERVVDLSDNGRRPALHHRRRTALRPGRKPRADTQLQPVAGTGAAPGRYAQDRDQRLRIRADLGRRRPVRRLHAGALADLQAPARPRVPDAAQLHRLDPARRTNRCLRADDHHVGDGRQGVQDPRAGCRPDRSRHQGDDQNAEHNRTNIQRPWMLT